MQDEAYAFDVYGARVKQIRSDTAEDLLIYNCLTHLQNGSLIAYMTEPQFQELLADVMTICSERMDILVNPVQFNAHYEDAKQDVAFIPRNGKSQYREWLDKYKTLLKLISDDREQIGANDYTRIEHQENLIKYSARVYALEQGWTIRINNPYAYPQ